MKKNIIIIAITYLALMMCGFFLDYFNIPSMIGININNFNFDFIGIFLNFSIVIILYLCTYYLIEKNNIKKNNNKLDILNYIFKSSYQECLNYIELLNRGDLEIDMFMEKVGETSELNKNEFFDNFVNAPFCNDNIVLNYINDGTLDLETFKSYFEIKNDYRTYFAHKIVYYRGKNEIIGNKLKIAEETIVKIINQELEKIKSPNQSKK